MDRTKFDKNVQKIRNFEKGDCFLYKGNFYLVIGVDKLIPLHYLNMYTFIVENLNIEEFAVRAELEINF